MVGDAFPAYDRYDTGSDPDRLSELEIALRRIDRTLQLEDADPAQIADRIEPLYWRPRFMDYLYVSLTNATAFSPTDTMPLTGMAKGVMGLQSIVSLVTIGLVFARAINVL